MYIYCSIIRFSYLNIRYDLHSCTKTYKQVLFSKLPMSMSAVTSVVAASVMAVAASVMATSVMAVTASIVAASIVAMAVAVTVAASIVAMAVATYVMMAVTTSVMAASTLLSFFSFSSLSGGQQ